ncbi:hypothetical protein [endosymbiont GvMRE of Glomus versiforme]|uniref:hypothetical protein n=1 Tax=endosymbiont GvMRE of Glomus versiforme TaxID=2039283 RepID=UPI000EDBC1C5|nr:hypothetical protein [endosymbiont GvMRE of Glomus versiforme]RHZ36578.1 Serine/threonine protein kinase [endosymbiont GvMRE of Glomus versiforme]RHZ36921.1 Serine/threonine protein kinase [endosymbiont GvMRE of Glomus versiforme]
MESNRDWREIHPDFNEYYQNLWKEHGFDYQTSQKWKEVLKEKFEVKDFAFYAWLRDEEHLISQKTEQQNNDRSLESIIDDNIAIFKENALKEHKPKIIKIRNSDFNVEGKKVIGIDCNSDCHFDIQGSNIKVKADEEAIGIRVSGGVVTIRNNKVSVKAGQSNNEKNQLESKEVNQTTFYNDLWINLLNDKKLLEENKLVLEQIAQNNQVNWINTHLSFTPQLIKTWQSYGFTFEQTRDWINIHAPSDQEQAIQEPEFYAYLRDEWQLSPEQVLNDNNIRLEDLRKQFREYQQSQQLQAQIIQPTYGTPGSSKGGNN